MTLDFSLIWCILSELFDVLILVAIISIFGIQGAALFVRSRIVCGYKMNRVVFRRSGELFESFSMI